MKEIKIKTVVLKNGKIVVEDLPFEPGEHVEVVIRLAEVAPLAFPLRGKPVRYDAPFAPVDESEWDALK